MSTSISHLTKHVPAHDHRGDLYRDGEDTVDTAKRVRAHLREALPHMEAKVRIHRGSGSSHIAISITRYQTADLLDRAALMAAKELIDTEMERFNSYHWDPNHGFSCLSMTSNIALDPSFRAAALDDAPEIEQVVSFAEFTRTARPGDLLEYVSGKKPHGGDRVVITAISARRLTTRSADPAADDTGSRQPIQGGSCFASDGDLICFKNSGFASQGGYSLVRWLRQR